MHGVAIHAFMQKVNKAKESICLWMKRCDCKKKIYLNSDRGDGIASDGKGMNGTTNENSASQHCYHQMGIRANACKKLGSVLGWKCQLHCGKKEEKCSCILY